MYSANNMIVKYFRYFVFAFALQNVLLLDIGVLAVFNYPELLYCDGHVLARTEGKTECCGEIAYNPSVDTCCTINEKRTVHTGVGSCCGNHGLYQPSYDVCCYSYMADEFRLHSLQIFVHEMCCGSELYDPNYQTCCYENILTGVGSCCGSATYDDTKEICCGGTIYQRTLNSSQCCDTIPYNPNTATCCYGTLHNLANGECCGYDAYLPSTSSCCHGVINISMPHIPGIQRCCGLQAYLSTEHICCSGLLFPKEENSECCGSVVYDVSQELCCADYPTTIYEKKSNDTMCCGITSYEPLEETCCGSTNQVFPIAGGQCCTMADGRPQAFHPNFGTCCSSGYEEIYYPGYSSYEHENECCGSHLLGLDELCDFSNLHPVQKARLTDDSVCSGTTAEEAQTYNSITSICSNNGILLSVLDSQTVCGNQLMDADNEICCSEVYVHAKWNEESTERRCCQGSMMAYTPSIQTCCNRMIFNIPEAEAGCCGYQAFHILTHICEGGSLVHPIGKPFMCGQEFYSKEDHVCCGDRELVGTGEVCCDGVKFEVNTHNINSGGCCGGIGFNPATQLCCGSNIHEISSKEVECCGNNTFSKQKKPHHICCQGNLTSNQGGRDRCMGQMSYNPSEETVCDDKVYPVRSGECCGSSLMDRSTQLCCAGNVILNNILKSFSCCGTESYNTDDPSVLCCNGILHHDVQPGIMCCNHQTYSPAFQKCCHDNREERYFIYSSGPDSSHRCCGSLLYNATKHQCCDGTLHEFKAKAECCGQAVLDGETNICCDNMQVAKSFGDASKCCGDQIYNSITQICHSTGSVMEKVTPIAHDSCLPHLQNCCGGQVYNDTTEACCGNVVVYDPSLQTCCGNELHTLLNGACCGIRQIPFQPAVQLCCEGRVRRKNKGNKFCCGRKSYNKNTSICCQGEMYSLAGNVECCGRYIFTPGQQVCCNGQLFNQSEVPMRCENRNDDSINQTSD